MKNYLLLLFLLLYSASFSEELVLKEMNILPKRFADAIQEKTKIKKVFILKDDQNRYYVEIFYTRDKKLLKKQIELSETDYESFYKEMKADELFWEKENDYNYAVYGTTLNTFIYASTMIDIDSTKLPEEVIGVITAGSSAGSFLYSMNKANKGYFYKRDFAGMENMSAAVLCTSYTLLDSLKTKDIIRNKTAATLAFLTYLKGKDIVEKYDLNIASTTMGLRSQFIGGMFLQSLYVEDFISWRKAAGIMSAISMPLFVAGTNYGKNLNLTTGTTAVCDNFSDAAALAAYQFKFKTPYKQTAACIAAYLPYVFAENIEKSIYFKENDNIGVKTGEAVGFLLGVAAGQVLDMSDTGLLLMGSAGITGSTFVTMKILGDREENKYSEKRNMAELKVNILPLLFPLAKVEGGGEVFRYNF